MTDSSVKSLLGRIELRQDDFERISSDELSQIVKLIKPLGLSYTVLDLEGYRTGGFVNLDDSRKNTKNTPLAIVSGQA